MALTDTFHSPAATARHTAVPQGVLRGPADADHYRVKVGRFGMAKRWYIDPLPGGGTWEAAPGAQYPSISAVKSVADPFTLGNYVSMKRLAKDLAETPGRYRDLSDWTDIYGRMKGIDSQGLRFAQDRGTNVHRMMERALRGQPYAPSPGERGAEYYRAVCQFLDTFQPELYAAEAPVIHRSLHGYGYGGTFDALVKINGSLVLPDWKSRDANSDHGAYPGEQGQVMGYLGADYMIVEDETGPHRMAIPEAEGWIVSIRPDGFRVYPIDPEHYSEHWREMHRRWVKSWADRDYQDWHPMAPTAIVDRVANAIRAAGSMSELQAAYETHRLLWVRETHNAMADARKAELLNAQDGRG
jgi:hypothetical protein